MVRFFAQNTQNWALFIVFLQNRKNDHCLASSEFWGKVRVGTGTFDIFRPNVAGGAGLKKQKKVIPRLRG